MQGIKNKIVLVTGAGRSLGRLIALHLAGLGANVAVNYNTSDKGAEEVCADISQLGCQTLLVQADVSNPTAVREMFQIVNSELGPVDVLVNNAAINIDATIRKMDDETWNRVLAVNLAGTFYCTRDSGVNVLLLRITAAAAADILIGGSSVRLTEKMDCVE